MPTKFEDIRADLFEAIYHVTQPALTQEQKDEVVSILNSRGHDMVWNAIRQHLSKLRKKEGLGEGGASAGTGTPKAAATPKTPRKRATPKAKGATKTPTSKGKRKAAESVAEDDDGSEGTPAPIKKSKSEEIDEDMMNSQYIKFDPNEEGAV